MPVCARRRGSGSRAGGWIGSGFHRLRHPSQTRTILRARCWSPNRTDRLDQLLGDDQAPGHSAANAAGRSLGTGDHDRRPFKTTEVVRRRAELTVYRFHHTSLVDGGKVIGAGEWIVRKGKLWKISQFSHLRVAGPRGLGGYIEGRPKRVPGAYAELADRHRAQFASGSARLLDPLHDRARSG